MNVIRGFRAAPRGAIVFVLGGFSFSSFAAWLAIVMWRDWPGDERDPDDLTFCWLTTALVVHALLHVAVGWRRMRDRHRCVVPFTVLAGVDWAMSSVATIGAIGVGYRNPSFTTLAVVATLAAWSLLMFRLAIAGANEIDAADAALARRPAAFVSTDGIAGWM